MWPAPRKQKKDTKKKSEKKNISIGGKKKQKDEKTETDVITVTPAIKINRFRRFGHPYKSNWERAQSDLYAWTDFWPYFGHPH